IIKIPVPCEEACPVDAITKDEHGKEQIDYQKCIFCGNCMRECPFGAMMDKSQLVDVIRHIMEGKKVVAMYAPAIASQFRSAHGQLEAALQKSGFQHVFEVALGADITADKEAHEFEHRMAHGQKLMTTSCCPAYVRAIRIHAKELNPCVSDTRSPMHYTAELVKKEHPECISVFIGPCLAKRKEGMEDDYVDYVLSAEEVAALFIAQEITVTQENNMPTKVSPSASGRNFASSGGVAQAVRLRLKNPEKLKLAVIDGLDKAGMKQLCDYGKTLASENSVPENFPNLVEVMACKGGCIAGPSVIENQKIAETQLKKYVEAASK
ncbi:MAG: [Fe-Fe] hydrogenase large subunit C-terminal domain-containing protein, partial [Treponemataceae bacterium]